MEKTFVDKPFKECEGGYYDANNFYITPNGSFWDPDGVYFNTEGVDRHGGYYDDHLEYHPGKGWIQELMCYEDEKEAELVKHNYEEDDDNDDILDDLYENNNLDIIKEEKTNKYKPNMFKPAKVNETKKEEVISPDKLFNKIPEDKIPKEIKNENKVKMEKKIEVDSLFN